MIGRWRIKFTSKSVNFSKKKILISDEQELKA